MKGTKMTTNHEHSEDFWDFQHQINDRLLTWSALSVLTGIFMLIGSRWHRGFGLQAITWGLIDAGIAGFGERTAERRRDKPETDPAKEARNLERLLWVNAGLDVLYVLWGLRMVRRGKGKPFQRGGGWGIVVQGVFLFVFDVFHAQRLNERR